MLTVGSKNCRLPLGMHGAFQAAGGSSLCFLLALLLCRKFFNGVKGNVADIMLKLACILRCGLFVDPQGDEKLCKQHMPLVYFFGNRATLIGQKK